MCVCACASCVEITEKLELLRRLFWRKAVWMCTVVNPHLFFGGVALGP